VDKCGGNDETGTEVFGGPVLVFEINVLADGEDVLEYGVRYMDHA